MVGFQPAWLQQSQKTFNTNVANLRIKRIFHEKFASFAPLAEFALSLLHKLTRNLWLVQWACIITAMNSIIFRAHAVQRMFEREVSVTKVREALQTADVIEDYSFETPEPSRLLFGQQGRRPFHVVTSESQQHITIITVYLPSLDKWKKDLRSRR